MSSYYDITRAKGGKDDVAIERGLLNKINELKAGSEIKISIDRHASWEGIDRVDMHPNGVYFNEREDYYIFLCSRTSCNKK